MSLRRSRVAVAAVLSVLLLAPEPVAQSSGATAPDATPETTGTTTPDSIVEASAPATSESADVEIPPPDESWDGLTRGELDAQYWQSVLSFPEEINPWFDPTGERCGYGQSGPVFTLVPSRGDHLRGRRGHGDLGDGGLQQCASRAPPPYFGRNEEELRACASEAIDGATDFQAHVNLEEVANLDTYPHRFTAVQPDAP